MQKILHILLTGILLATSSNVYATDPAEITVGTGDATDSTSPVNMYNWDRVGQSEVIYPADILTELIGKTVTAVKFYMQPAMSKDFAGANIKVYVGTTERESFTDSNNFTPTEDLIMVYNGNQSFTKGDTEWTIKFSTPFTYNGGNLSLRIDNEKGKYNRVYFRGDNTDKIQSVNKSNSISSKNFLPLSTFICGEASGPGASLSGTSLSFPITVVGDTDAKVQSIRVNNTGSTDLSGNVTIEGSDAFTVSPDQITALKPGESVQLNFTFNPTEAGDFSAEATVSLGDAGSYAIKLSGSAYAVPNGVSSVFSASDYDTAMPEGWTGYALELTTAGDFSASTTDYSEFPTTARFESRTLAGSPMILWNHGNPMPSSDLYQRYYYLVSPASQGHMWFRAIASEAAAVGPFIKAYAVTPGSRAEGEYTIGDEINITWDEPLNNTSWATASFDVPAGTQVAFFMKYAGLSTFVNTNSSAITDITTDSAIEDSNAPVEYYNLQGMRITNPCPGQLLIRRQGRNVTKIVVR